MRENEVGVVTIPNGITAGRLVAGMIGVWIASIQTYFLIGILIFFVLGMIPDFFDGWYARRFNQVSRFGEFFDPLADKILFYSAIYLIFWNIVWWRGVMALLALDAISTFIHFYKKGGAKIFGKWKFGMQCAALVCYALYILFGKVYFFQIVGECTILAALACATISLWTRIRA